MTEAEHPQSDSATEDATPGVANSVSGERNAKRATRLAVALIVGLAAVFFARSFSEGFSTVVGAPECDALSMFYPLRAFANGEMQDGRLPLWNPHEPLARTCLARAPLAQRMPAPRLQRAGPG